MNSDTTPEQLVNVTTPEQLVNDTTPEQLDSDTTPEQVSLKGTNHGKKFLIGFLFILF